METEEREIIDLKRALLKANLELERLSKVKSDFISIVSHELRTPLTSIKESIALVLDGVSGPLNEDQKQFLTIARNNIDRLVKIITEILDFSRLESGRVTMHKRKADINTLIKDVSDSFRYMFTEKKIEFNLELSDTTEPVWFDPDRIKQVLQNLISNAIKFNRDGGKIKISSGKEMLDKKEVLKIIVEDTGIGISKEDIPKLFRHFTPLYTDLARPYPGLGLGLAICRGIIELHGGEIWAESEKNSGSRFIFTLPVYRKDREFNFLLDESIERARHNGLKLALILFTVRAGCDADEESCMRLEETMSSAVRGPEDKVVRYRNGRYIAIMAGTDRSGANKIVKRLDKLVSIPLSYGMAIYPDEAREKQDMVKKAELDMNSGKNRLR